MYIYAVLLVRKDYAPCSLAIVGTDLDKVKAKVKAVFLPTADIELWRYIDGMVCPLSGTMMAIGYDAILKA